jgi:hypothetical protein
MANTQAERTCFVSIVAEKGEYLLSLQYYVNMRGYVKRVDRFPFFPQSRTYE